MFKISTTSEIQFDLDKKESLLQYWQKAWIHIGHEQEVPEIGDYFTATVLDYSIIILRADSGEILALSNSCRHRGSLICQTHRGTGPNLVCPYHQWTYDLKGNLKYAHSMMKEIDCNDFKLKSFNVTIQNGLIFINVSDDAEPFTSPLTADNSLNLLAHCTATFKGEPTYHNMKVLTDSLTALLPNSPQISKTLKLSDNARFFEHDDWSVLLSFFPNSKSEMRLETKLFSKVPALADQTIIDIFKSLEMPFHAIERFDQSPTDQNTQSVQYWTDKEPLVCTMVNEDTHNVKTFTFQTTSGKSFDYKPGQFITLELPVPGHDQPLMRTYTLSSSPSRPLSVSVTAKAQPDSIGTRWMFDNLKPGSLLKAYGPSGQFSFFEKPAKKYLFLSAGSGITPMLSMTRWLYDASNEADINFINCIQTPKDQLFKHELKTMSKRNPGIKITWVCERADDKAWKSFTGHINLDILKEAASDYLDRDVYCCGPEPFMRAVRNMLSDSGFDMNQYQEEAFSLAPDDTEYTEDELKEKLTISFSQSNVETECARNESLLQAAQKASVPLASTCAIGVCGTCKVKLEKGKVNMNHNGGISQKEIDEGFILACCSRPTTDVTLAK